MKLLLSFLLAGLISCLFPLSVNAEENEGTPVKVEYYSVTSGRPSTFEVNYSDRWFLTSSEVYNHDLAQASLGLMASCFRPGSNEEGISLQDSSTRAKSFLEETGFQNIRTDDYDRPSGRYTVASIIGRKTLTGEDGEPFTLLAVGICGQGYQNEWLSNLSIGDSNDHVGFEDAAQDVYDRIFGYLAENEIKGRVKVWVSGFSRSAAISNLLSARLIRSRQIASEDLFAYLYATPRCTKNHTNNDYPGIFNIVGMTDPVPQVPFLDWGYDRYGNTYYLPSQETDSDYFAMRKDAGPIYMELTGKELKNNPEMNARVKMLLEYMLILCPTPEIYMEHMQPRLLALWDDKSPVTLLKTLLELADDPVLVSENNRMEANGFMNYLSYLLFDYVLGNDEFSDDKSDSSLAVTIMREHTPDVYIAWMLSSENPTELFASQNEYSRVVISGDCNIYILNASTEEFIQEIDQDGTIQYMDPDIQLFCIRQKTQTILIVPRDFAYDIGIEALKDQTVKLNQIHYTSEQTGDTEYKTRDAEMKKGEMLILSLPRYNENESDLNLITDELEIEQLRFSYGESTSSILAFERLNIFHLNWKDFVILVITATAILAALAAFQFTYLIGAIRYRQAVRRNDLPKGSKYHPLPVLALCLIYVLFLAKEFISALYPEAFFVTPLFKALIGSCLIFTAWSGYKQNPSPMHKWVTIGLCVSALADLIINYWLYAGAMLHCAALLICCYAFWTFEKPEPWQLALAAVFAVQGSILIFYIVPDRFAVYEKLLASLYYSSAVFLITVSMGVPERFRTGAFLLILTGILLVVNFLYRETFISHLISLGTYYLGLCFLAGGTLIHPHILNKKKKGAANALEIAE